MWFATKNVQSVCFFLLSDQRGRLWSQKNIDYFTRRERMFTQRFWSRECKYKTEIRRGDWQMLGAVLTLGPSHSWCPTLQRVQRMWERLTNILTRGLRHCLLLATSRLTSWRMTWEYLRPAALTNDFDGTEDKMFLVWRLKQFICFIDLQYKGKEIIEH